MIDLHIISRIRLGSIRNGFRLNAAEDRVELHFTHLERIVMNVEAVGCVIEVPTLSSIVQCLMYEGHRDRPFTHCGGYPFDIAGPDVADGEYAGQTSFEEMGALVSGHCAAAKSSCDRSAPVLMNPLASSVTHP